MGKTNKEVVYDLSPYTTSGREDASNSSSVLLGDYDVGDKVFIDTFTLSLFRKDSMVLTGDQFPEEYGLDKKSLDPKCKIFIQKQWDSSSWTEIPPTEMFLWTLREQIPTKGRMKNRILKMRFSLGRSTACALNSR